jgi:hypothetical protein
MEIAQSNFGMVQTKTRDTSDVLKRLADEDFTHAEFGSVARTIKGLNEVFAMTAAIRENQSSLLTFRQLSDKNKAEYMSRSYGVLQFGRGKQSSSLLNWPIPTTETQAKKQRDRITIDAFRDLQSLAKKK